MVAQASAQAENLVARLEAARADVLTAAVEVQTAERAVRDADKRIATTVKPGLDAAQTVVDQPTTGTKAARRAQASSFFWLLWFVRLLTGVLVGCQGGVGPGGRMEVRPAV